MSDGPHRSLPMSRSWKTVARFAYQAAYDAPQTQNALQRALRRDCKEIPGPLLPALNRLFSGNDNPLGLPGLGSDQLEACRPLANGSVFGQRFIAYAAVAIAEGRTGPNDFLQVVRDTLNERAAAGARQVEEHGLRDPRVTRPTELRAKLRQAVAGVSQSLLAEHVLASTPSGPLFMRAKGIDEGPPL